MNVKSQGAGLPDGGLFTTDQFQKASATEPLPGQLPSRGVIEVKGTGDDAWLTADSPQVSKYWERYRLVLVTNYRDFLLLGADEAGQPVKLESSRLAENENAFWAAAATPRATAEKLGPRFIEFLKRVLLHAAPLSAPKDVAWFLASYARDALSRLEAGGAPTLAPLRAALEEALGLKFEGEKGEHFFRSTLVQTLFYGVFSAWVLWCKNQPPGSKAKFDWHAAEWSLHVPMIRTLFEQIATPGQLKPLNLVEVLDWTAAALNRVVRAAFFAKFEEAQAVQYFYEPFLEAFDPDLRKELGVWYTPPEIVHYMVERVDRVLRTELGIADGLADPRVYVLDPCCGTGSYLVETLRRIARTLAEKGESALLGQELKRAATTRVFGFEILPAPYVVAHWQIGNFLQSQIASLSDEKAERAAIYLTNALTGWEPPKGPKQHLMFPELEQERDAADQVKRDVPILVILGNPPYNAFAGTSPAEEEGLVEPYKEGLVKKWGIKKFNLDDLYVRFFRLAERRIAEQTGRGVVSFISNYSWVSEPSFVVLREHLLKNFDRFWIENMHGNRKISEYAPDGRTSETIFAIPGFSVGIQQGVVVSLWVKTGDESTTKRVLFRDDLTEAKATDRRRQLVESLNAPEFDSRYEDAAPTEENRFSFRPATVAAHYMEWPKLSSLALAPPFNGLFEKRGNALIDFERARLETRMRRYYDNTLEWDALKHLDAALTKDAARFSAKKARSNIIATESFSLDHLQQYTLRPFDTRWCYYSATRPLWNEPRPQLWAQVRPGNKFLVSRPAGVASPEGVPFYFTRLLGDNDALRGHAYYLPLILWDGGRRRESPQGTLSGVINDDETAWRANVSPESRNYLAVVGIANPDEDAETAAIIWLHSLAIGYSPAYLADNANGIRQDWPRVPLPNSREALLASAALGREIAALLDTETPSECVTSGTIRPVLGLIAQVARTGGSQLSPNELAVTAGWGHTGKKGAVMPGKGKVMERDYSPEERTSFGDVAEAVDCLGAETCDLYLNDTAYWKNVPEKVWNYTIGGYQVMKKWLSYREEKLLGRPLTLDEVREVTNMARRIAAILLLTPRLDANYCAVRDAAYPWPRNKS